MANGAGQPLCCLLVSYCVLRFHIWLPIVSYVQARGKQIRRKREVAGHGLNAFAQLVGISPSWLSRIERDLSVHPSPKVLVRIAE